LKGRARARLSAMWCLWLTRTTGPTVEEEIMCHSGADPNQAGGASTGSQHGSGWLAMNLKVLLWGIDILENARYTMTS